MARLELPHEAWAGWTFQGGILITPEGRQIEPRDSSWWSLMVRNARSFHTAYTEVGRLRMLVHGLESQLQASAEGAAEAAGLVPSKTKRKTTIDPTSNSSQNDVTIESLTPSFALPWTPICGVQLRYQRPHLVTCVNLSQSPHGQNLSNPPSSPEPKSKPSTKHKSSNVNDSSALSEVSARPAAAHAAKLASASRGAK